MSEPTPATSLYRVYFTQPNNADHEALALISEKSSERCGGYLHHVIGMLALGMEYQIRRSKDIKKEKGYSHQILLGSIAPTDVDKLEGICQSVKPPCDERLLFENRTKLEARGETIRDCAGWIDDVLASLEAQGILNRTA